MVILSFQFTISLPFMELILKNWQYVALLVIILGVILVIALISAKKETLPYRKKKYLLNKSERNFFKAVAPKLPHEYVMYPQIVMSALLETKTAKKDFWQFQNKINKKIIDFVIFEKKFLEPILAIEYDGPTHQRYDRKQSDAFKNKVLQTVGIQLKHVVHSENMNYNAISHEINSILQEIKNT